MDAKETLYHLRTQKGLSQAELAEKVFVTRQAVSRWESGETTPNTETLKLLSALFGVSINTLLGLPRQLRCQCCGMPLDDSLTSREPGGLFNENTASGAMPMANSSTAAGSSLLISAWSTWRAQDMARGAGAGAHGGRGAELRHWQR